MLGMCGIRIMSENQLLNGYANGITPNVLLYACTAPLQMIDYKQIVVPKWVIKEYPDYFIDADDKLRNFKNGKILKMQLKGYTKGYYLNGCFKSLHQIRPLLVRYKEESLPF